MRIKKNYNESGFTLVEVIASLTIFSLMIPVVYNFLRIGEISNLRRAAATHMERVAGAAEKYVKENFNTIKASATASASYSISLQDLKTDGFLESGFKTQNIWKQDYTVYVLQPKTNFFHILVLTSNGKGHTSANREFGTRIVPKTATLLGAKGGYIPAGVIPGEPDTIIKGAFGGWEFSFAGTDVPNPGAGHLGVSMYFHEDALGRDYLYRNKVPGHPELNTMYTSLDMNGNTILMGDGEIGGGDGEGVKKLNFEDHEVSDFTCASGDDYGGSVFYDDSDGLYVCRNGKAELIADTGNSSLIKNTYIVANNSNIPKPQCPVIAPNPQIFLSPVIYSQNNTAKPLRAVQTWATSNGNNWVPHLRVMTRDGWTSPGSSYGQMLAIIKCSP